MVLLASSFDKSKFMTAADFTSEKALRIKSVTAEMVRGDKGPEQKLVLEFTNHQKRLPLNATNRRTLMGAFGDNTEMWIQKIFIIYPTMTEFGGKPTPALRIRIPPPKQAVAGNGQPTKVVQQEVLPPEPKPPLKDDLDDEIGF
jgi:hypothetical protein